MIQGCLLRVHMCLVDRSQDVSSRMQSAVLASVECSAVLWGRRHERQSFTTNRAAYRLAEPVSNLAPGPGDAASRRPGARYTADIGRRRDDRSCGADRFAGQIA
jgi:hypothetical protein